MRPGLEKSRRGIRLRCDGSEGITAMAIFKKPTLKTQSRKKRDIPQGLFQKCPGCNEVIHEIELNENLRVCPRCDYHFALSAKDRIQNLLDPQTFLEMDADLKSIDTLRFQGMASYKDRLKNYQERTGLTDAVISGHGMIDGYKVALAVMDFGFLAATMGSVVGERITRVIEYGTSEHAAVVIVSASGGARMYEGMLSLMQMAKTSGALARHPQERPPYISVLTNATTAGARMTTGR
jgi:acetyl-CoA carboxylase carboxyl transferase subunit beta